MSFFQFMANLQTSGSGIPDAWSIKLTFSFIVIFYVTKISNTTLILLLWVKVLFLPKNSDFLQKNADISKIKGVWVLKGIFSETTYVCVLTYQTSSFLA